MHSIIAELQKSHHTTRYHCWVSTSLCSPLFSVVCKQYCTCDCNSI